MPTTEMLSVFLTGAEVMLLDNQRFEPEPYCVKNRPGSA